MKKIVAASAVVLGLGLSSMAFAGGDAPVVASSPSGFGFTFAFTNFIHGQGLLGLNYRSSLFEAGLLVSGEYDGMQSSDNSFVHADAQLYLGSQHAMSSRVDLTYGVQGDYRYYSDKAKAGVDNNPIEVGPYLGLSFNPTSHFSVFTRMSPVTYKMYAINDDNDKQITALYFACKFTTGLAYFF